MPNVDGAIAEFLSAFLTFLLIYEDEFFLNKAKYYYSINKKSDISE